MMASIALILSCFANSRCYLADVDKDSVLRLIVRPEPDSIGLWCFESTNGNNYDSTEFALGSKYNAARGLGTTTLGLGLGIWIFYLVAVWVRFGPTLFKLIGSLCILTCLSQGLTFLVFKSVVCSGSLFGCGLGVGGRCGISAIFFWFLAGIFSCGAGKKNDDDAPPEVPDNEDQDNKAVDDVAQNDKVEDQTADEE